MIQKYIYIYIFFFFDTLVVYPNTLYSDETIENRTNIYIYIYLILLTR